MPPRALAVGIAVVVRTGLVLAVAGLSLARAPAGTPAAAAPARPELPRAHVDTTYVAPSGRTIAVPAGGDFQAALASAQPGDVIALAAGATFKGPFVLPDKPGAGWITVRTSAPDSALPPPGARINPSYARALPKIVAPGPPAIETASGAHQYRFIGVEFAPTPGQRDALQLTLIALGNGEASVRALPRDIIFDRCYIHGDPSAGARRGIEMDSASTAVIDSYLSDFKLTVSEALPIQGHNGPGPFKIVNNYLEGAGMGVMFGGADPSIPNLVPADIEIRGNHFAKPLSWRVGDPTYARTPWIVKNLFELKNARRVLVDGNIFEYNWRQADQDGFAIVFTPRNQSGSAPWSTVEDVTFTHNIVRHSTAGVYMLGWDDLSSGSRQLQRVLIQNNVFTDIGAFPSNGGSVGRLFQLRDGAANIVIDHNTAFQDEAPVFASVGTGVPNTGFVYTNNFTLSDRGVSGDRTWGNPLATLEKYFPGSVFARNVLVGGDPSSYPPNNFFPSSLADVGFVDFAGGNLRFTGTSLYKNAGTDGKAIGADVDAVSAATSSRGQATSQP